MTNKHSHLWTAAIAAICGAILVFSLLHFDLLPLPFKKGENSSSVEQKDVHEEKTMYICPMHPQIIRDHPSNCPICGMALVPMKDHDKGADMPSDAVRIEATMIQSIGVNMVEVGEVEMEKSVRILGNIDIDPQKIAVINARSMGWIESIPQGTEGTKVFAGQRLASFYSPDLVAAQEEYLQALRVRDENLVASALKRLEVLGIPAAIVDTLQKNKEPVRTLPILSPISGVVLARTIVQGQNVMPGFDMYRIADLSSVWVVGKAYPEEVVNLSTGMDVQVAVQGLENSPRNGKLIFVAPIVDPETKTTEIRVEIKNSSDLKYKPGMNADIRVKIPLGTGISIPAQAVIHTGERTVAIVSLGKGYFAPRNLTLGATLGDSVQVIDGLSPGDSLVTSAQFLIDSESNLKKAVQSFETQEKSDAGHNH